MSTNESSRQTNDNLSKSKKTDNLNTSEERIIKGATTLDFSITPEDCPANEGEIGGYFKLTYGKPYKTIVRKELIRDTKYARKHKKEIKRNKKCIKKRTALATFIQITDVHIIDATSPSRAAFLYLFAKQVPGLVDSFRAYEAFSTQVAECMVRKINSICKGPHLGQDIQFVVNTGDNGDGEQINEAINYINLLDGKMVTPNPASPGKYVGIQDNFPSIVYEGFYHPDHAPLGKNPDSFKVNYGYPEYPNILNVASRPFKATGLKVPWFTNSGNHDETKLGNYSLGFFKMFTLFDQLATGTLPDGLGSKLIEAMTPLQAEAFVKALQLQDSDAALNIIKTSNLREIPRSDKRLQYSKADYIRLHLNSSLKPGPTEIASSNLSDFSKRNSEQISTHGLTLQNVEENTLYYTFEISEKVSGISLDSCNPSGNLENPSLAPNGGFGRIQILFLEKELRKRHSSYFNDVGEIVRTNNKDKLIVLFFHHSLETLNNDFNSPTTFDPDPQKIINSQFIPLVHRYPNICLLVVGHEHLNKITPFPDKTGKSGGFWEIVTASHIDYPQQSRIIEIAENNNNTISIYGTLIDSASKPDVFRGCFPTGTNANCCRSKSSCCSTETNSPTDTQNNTTSDCNTKSCDEEYTIEEMASISRELSYNNFELVNTANDGIERLGKPKDRNVELLLFNPLKRCL